MAFSYTKDGESDPTFLFFNDGLRQEKYWNIDNIMFCEMKNNFYYHNLYIFPKYKKSIKHNIF